ncbi:2OG-Fe(II) oxygenase [Erwinia mallotivora]|uniref:Prolyl 4-hydroxylase alpha subunit Fe(2+) 2OG dioxygenase domain-containing protein n=1 Tax=Erwinia mallotivora TaxID=69222 RepID=A0A014NA39_9GAMM|nr:2OG-Fe(II) oxygenase [Erwinia mallotivora]EXU76228.1 hypothetical protein BG55_06435 [Erwinia mallotivora]
MKFIKVADNQFDDDVLSDTLDIINNKARWEFGSLSDREGFSYGHWEQTLLHVNPRNQDDKQHLLQQNPDFAPINKIWEVLEANWLPGHKLVRCYVNAHTYGIEGYPHTDSRTPGHFTTLIYLNQDWCPEWAGETVFFDHAGDIIHSVLPSYGRMAIFDGLIPHAARSVSRRCPELRQTLVLKSFLKPQESELEIAARKLIDSCNNSEPNTYGYKIADHSLGLHTILKNNDANQQVLSASLFYLLYLYKMSNGEDISSLRQDVRNIVNEENEAFVYSVASFYYSEGESKNNNSIAELTSSPPKMCHGLHPAHPMFSAIALLEIGIAIYTNTLYKDKALCKLARELGYLAD